MSLRLLNKEIIECRKCPRLVEYRESIVPKREEKYWDRPIPGFGDTNGWLLLIGSAPAPHGGNRTGRIFTGDPSGDFLMQALFETGFANQPNSDSRDDGLVLTGCYISDIVRCVPPKHKPTLQECRSCVAYLKEEVTYLKKLTHVITLGRLAFDHFMPPKTKFEFGKVYTLETGVKVLACYHPSPRNTNTGKLSASLFKSFLRKF